MEEYLMNYARSLEYLAHRYELDALPDFPLADEPFVNEWKIWLENPNESPSDVKDILSDDATPRGWEKNFAGKIPVVYTRSRTSWTCTLFMYMSQTRKRTSDRDARGANRLT